LIHGDISPMTLDGRDIVKTDRLTRQSKGLAARLAINQQLEIVRGVADEAAQLHESVVKALGEPHILA
jgi:hypothetical protein